MTIAFAPTEEGVEVFDPIERRQYVLGTAAPVSPVPAAPDRLDVPVDDAVAVETSAVSLPDVVGVYVRDADGDLVSTVEFFGEESLPAGAYTVELATPVKTYLRVTSPVTVTAGSDAVTIDFGETRTVVVGARSRHEHPAATVTTTSDPRDVMAAVSQLGSALKTTSPERSYPTLRGHPPLVELGDEFDVPDAVERPETGVTIRVPPAFASIYAAAPLAYYLGARVEPGAAPRIVTDDGFVHSLDTERGVEDEIARVLKQTFVLDCVVRTEGIYDVDLHERSALEPHLGFDPASLYDRPLREQLATYLDVPYDVVEPHVPEWTLTTHVAPEPEQVELLPFVVDDLAVVRETRTRETGPPTTTESAAIDAFVRDGEFTRSAGAEASTPASVTAGGEALEEAWVGAGAPLGASKPTATAFHNRLDRDPADGDIDITVVCNDPAMAAERDVVSEVYGSREALPFDLTVHRELTSDQLRARLAEQTEFLHYIGHIDDDGFECADGRLDATTLDAVGVDAFLLNACASYEQGMALIDAGSIGGVVTLAEVVNSGAVTVGQTMARLLNRGFPLRAALRIAGGESIVGNQYAVVGDGAMSIAQAESGTPYLCEVTELDAGYELTLQGYPTKGLGMGAMFMPCIEDNDEYFLNSGTIHSFEVTLPELSDFLDMEDVPVRVDGTLHWSDDLDPLDLLTSPGMTATD